MLITSLESNGERCLGRGSGSPEFPLCPGFFLRACLLKKGRSNDHYFNFLIWGRLLWDYGDGVAVILDIMERLSLTTGSPSRHVISLQVGSLIWGSVFKLFAYGDEFLCRRLL